jgi:hypothetical protein
VLTTGFGGPTIGVPSKDVAGAVDAGEIVQLRIDPRTGRVGRGRAYSENSPGVSGPAQAGDRFGAAVAPGGYGVGIPGRRVGTIAEAGAVQTFRPDDATRTGGPFSPALRPAGRIDETSPAIPAVEGQQAQTGDHFGAALAIGWFRCSGVVNLAIGAPGDDLDPHGTTDQTGQDAGSVTLVGLPLNAHSASCPAHRMTPGGDLGLIETGTRVGAAIGLLRTDAVTRDRRDTLLVGLPGKNANPVAAAGQVAIWTNKPHFHEDDYYSFGFQTHDLPGLGYGTVFSLGTMPPDVRLPG